MAFTERYSKYVLQRAKTFTSKFEEMKVIGEVRLTSDVRFAGSIWSMGLAIRVGLAGLGCGCGCDAYFRPSERPGLTTPWRRLTHPPVTPHHTHTQNLQRTQRDIVPKDLVGQLGKAEKVLASGLDCAVDPEEENEVRTDCM